MQILHVFSEYSEREVIKYTFSIISTKSRSKLDTQFETKEFLRRVFRTIKFPFTFAPP